VAGSLTLSTLSDGTNSTNATDVIRGSARAWVNFNGSTAAIKGSYNVSSITKISTGQYNVNLTNAMSDTNYVVNNTQQPPSDRLGGCAEFWNFARTTSAYGVSVGDAGAYYDSTNISSSLFR
jgi:hypothetical protein